MYHFMNEDSFIESTFAEPKVSYASYQSKYIDPLTDFGFKFIFGSEPNKDILIDFLNAIFQGSKVIVDLTYNNTESTGENQLSRDVFFDLLCTGQDGEQFIIEMQRKMQSHFMDRCMYYASRIISEQAPDSGEDWNYTIKGVYLIAILDFDFKLNPGKDYLVPIKLINTNTQTLFYDKIAFLFLELRKFDKEEKDLVSDLDKWCYVLKHLHRLEKMPVFLNKRIFQKIFNLAEVGKLNKKERMSYDRALKARRDYNNTINYAKEEAMREGKAEGLAEGKAEGKAETIRANVINMYQKELTIETIAEIVNLSVDDVHKIITSN